MFKYIIKDLTAAIHYLPIGLIVGVFAAAIVRFINRRRRGKGKAALPVEAVCSLVMYTAVILCITFFSRESGTRSIIDLEIFSTWGINARNNAYVIENILLFIPFGFVVAWNAKWVRNLLTACFAGVVTSLAVEGMQFVTGRGFFQIDDVLTNTLGMILGVGIFCVGRRLCQAVR